ncbi:hypothetical protein JCM5353_002518 [Sporobolomyces roseus]
MPINLPPELVHYILDSTLFSSNDLAHIALASRNFLSFARHNLYNYIGVTTERERIGVLAGDDRSGSGDRRIRRPQPFEVFLLNASLHPFVRKIGVNGDDLRPIGERSSLEAVSMILDRFPLIETLVLAPWRWLSAEWSTMLARHQSRRPVGQTLSMHVRTTHDCLKEQNGVFDMPLSGFDTSNCPGWFSQTALAASETSLQALGFRITSILGYQGFPNVKSLCIGVAEDDWNVPVSQLLDSLNRFRNVETLTLSFGRTRYTTSVVDLVLLVLSHSLPSTLRSLFVGCDLAFHEIDKIVRALPEGTGLKRLTFRPSLNGTAVTQAVAEVTAGRSRQQVDITVEQSGEIWDNLCTSRPSLYSIKQS